MPSSRESIGKRFWIRELCRREIGLYWLWFGVLFANYYLRFSKCFVNLVPDRGINVTRWNLICNFFFVLNWYWFRIPHTNLTLIIYNFSSFLVMNHLYVFEILYVRPWQPSIEGFAQGITIVFVSKHFFMLSLFDFLSLDQLLVQNTIYSYVYYIHLRNVLEYCLQL